MGTKDTSGIHAIISNDGMYIQMPKYKGGQVGWGNLAIPSPYEIETLAQYPIATKFVDGENAYRYIQAGNACTAGRILVGYNAFATATSGDGTTRETATIAAAASDGDTTITCTDQGSATPEDIFAGGFATIYWEFQVKYIESNTKEDSGGEFILTFDFPLDQDIASTSVVSCYRNIFADVRYLTSGVQALHGSGCCVSNKTITDTNYGWGQTAGICGLAGVDNVGAGSDEIGMYNHSGAVYFNMGSHASNNQPAYQYVGYIAGYTGHTGADFPGALIPVKLCLGEV